MKIKIRTPSRIHITLIDLNGALGRIDGGVGLALEEPYIEIIAQESSEVVVKCNSSNVGRFKDIAKKLNNLFGKALKIDVLSDYKSHVGLGSGTQISLAVAEAYNRLFNLGYSVRKLAEIVGRGGTSGIGVAAFEMGGFIVDGGHSKKEKREFLPSSAVKAKPAPVIARHDFPDWDIVLAIPNITGFHGKREVNLFKKYCPISIEEVRKLTHVILMKMLPAVVEQDLDEFRDALWITQNIGFKKIEIDQYGDLIRDILNYMHDITAIGMSSTGPTVFAITDSNAKSLAKELEKYFDEKDYTCETIVTKARNIGADIKIV